MTSPIDTLPRTVEQVAVEDIVYGIDCTALLSGTQTVTVVTSTLTDNKVNVTLTDTAGVTGNVVTQRIRAGTLIAGNTYQWQITINPSGTTNILASALQITCVD